MTDNRFVIVDTSNGLYFAKNQEDRFTKDNEHVSRWTDKDKAQETLDKIVKDSVIKEKVGKLTIMKLQDAKKKIAQNANKQKIAQNDGNLVIDSIPYWQQAEHLAQLVSSIFDKSLDGSEHLDCVNQLNKELKRLTRDHNLDDLTTIYRYTNPDTDLLAYDAYAIVRFVRRFVYTYPKPIDENFELIDDDSKPIVENFVADNLEPISENFVADDSKPIVENFVADNSKPIAEKSVDDDSKPIAEKLIADDSKPITEDFVVDNLEPIAEKLVADDSKSIVGKPITDDLEPIVDDNGETEQAKLFDLLKFVCSIVTEIQQEELSYVQKSLCVIAAESNEIKNSISKKIREYDNKDLDFLHVIELGKFNAVQWAKLIAFERENRQKRRQYKDEWSAIDALFPNTEPDMTKIKSQAKKCLKTIKLVEGNNRSYAFRDKESKKRFGNLLK